jgi:hypothetical protein
MPRRAVIVVTLLLTCTLDASAQEAHQHDTPSQPWQWTVEATAFAGYNYQRRKFTDFDELESQNWPMTALSKSFGAASHLRIDAMFSFEPFTLRDIGSPQVFQTGETFNGGPVIDYQPPHDLIMNLGAEYSRAAGATTISLQAYAVGPAPIGPQVFMHRVEKTDRLYRNIKDWVTIDELGIEVHFVKENVVLSEDSRSSEKFMHGIKVLMAKNYIDNLGEEVRKGMIEKARQGQLADRGASRVPEQPRDAPYRARS